MVLCVLYHTNVILNYMVMMSVDGVGEAAKS